MVPRKWTQEHSTAPSGPRRGFLALMGSKKWRKTSLLSRYHNDRSDAGEVTEIDSGEEESYFLLIL